MAFGRKRPKAPSGRLQVATYGGRPVVDPPEEALRQMVLDLARDTDEYVVVAQVADPATYVQVLHTSDGRWVVEHQAGSDEAHAHAFVADVHTAAAIVVAWSVGDPGWPDRATWQDGSHS